MFVKIGRWSSHVKCNYINQSVVTVSFAELQQNQEPQNANIYKKTGFHV